MMTSQMILYLSHLVVLMLLIIFVDDCFDDAYSYVTYMVTFISSRRIKNLEYTSSLFDDVNGHSFMLCYYHRASKDA